MTTIILHGKVSLVGHPMHAYQSMRGAKYVLYILHIKCHNDYVIFTNTWMASLSMECPYKIS